MADTNTPLGRLTPREKATIENLVEKQIQWVESNPDAKLDELILHKNQLEETVSRIIDEIVRRSASSSNDTRPPSHSHGYEL